jgi:hypothetical protein
VPEDSVCNMPSNLIDKEAGSLTAHRAVGSHSLLPLRIPRRRAVMLIRASLPRHAGIATSTIKTVRRIHDSSI